MAEVFLCRTGALTARALRDLRKAGIVVVEADEPKDCQFIRSSEVISGSAMLVAALTAIATKREYAKATDVREIFVGELFKAATEAKPLPTGSQRLRHDRC